MRRYGKVDGRVCWPHWAATGSYLHVLMYLREDSTGSLMPGRTAEMDVR